MKSPDGVSGTRVTLQSYSGVCALCLPESASNFVESVVKSPALGALLFSRQHDVRYLHRWRLTRQCKHLVHGDPGSDRCITQTSLANRFLHSARSEFGDVGEHHGESLFSFGYVLSFTVSDGPHCVSGHAVKLGDLIHAGVRISQ
jgi:hypothetical protein